VAIKGQWKKLGWFALAFAACYWLPVGQVRFDNAVSEALHLVRWYAREHVVLCLVPAFFIAGAISVFVSQASVMKYLGPKANKLLSYGVASVSGTILAVCSCTVLPLFAGIRSMGAGLGPATTFLYAGPAINVLAIIFTARVLGMELGVARAVGAVVFSVVIGVLMTLIFRRQEAALTQSAAQMPEPQVDRPLWKNAVYFAAMIAILVFANWGKPDQSSGLWYAIYNVRWPIVSGCGVLLAVVLVLWFQMRWWHMLIAALPVVLMAILLPDRPVVAFATAIVALSVVMCTPSPRPPEGDPGKPQADLGSGSPSEWFDASWGFAKQILPLLLLGVLAAGLLLGRPGHEGLIQSQWIDQLVGGNSIRANAFASVVGALMYFATLTEVPILRGLMDAGMGKGPALALLLAGPAVSLPNLLVIRSIMGTRKTLVFALLVIVMATVSGMVYGALF